jgi:recombinational DNA repair ATPase RecF
MSTHHTPQKFAQDAGFCHGWENLESWARRMAEHGVRVQRQRDELMTALREISTAENRKRMAEIAFDALKQHKEIK